MGHPKGVLLVEDVSNENILLLGTISPHELMQGFSKSRIHKTIKKKVLDDERQDNI